MHLGHRSGKALVNGPLRPKTAALGGYVLSPHVTLCHRGVGRLRLSCQQGDIGVRVLHDTELETQKAG